MTESVTGRLTKDFLNDSSDFRRLGQIPKQPLLGGRLELRCSLAVEWIGGGDQERFAQLVKRQDAPAKTNFRRETSSQFDVRVIFIQRQIAKPCFVREDAEGLIDLKQPFVVE